MNTLPAFIESHSESSVYRQVLSRNYPHLQFVYFEAASEHFASSRDYMILSGTKEVGHCMLNMYQPSQLLECNFSDIEVYERGRGLGVAAYLLGFDFAAHQNADFLSDMNLQPKALERWQKFVALGVAEYITRTVSDDETEYSERTDVNSLFTGSKFRVLRPTEISYR